MYNFLHRISLFFSDYIYFIQCQIFFQDIHSELDISASFWHQPSDFFLGGGGGGYMYIFHTENHDFSSLFDVHLCKIFQAPHFFQNMHPG